MVESALEVLGRAAQRSEAIFGKKRLNPVLVRRRVVHEIDEILPMWFQGLRCGLDFQLPTQIGGQWLGPRQEPSDFLLLLFVSRVLQLPQSADGLFQV